MLRSREIILIALFVSAIWIVVLALQLEPSAYHEICNTGEYTGKESCAPHHIPYVITWYIGYWFDKASAVITAFATAAIAGFTIVLSRIGKRQAEDARIVQRAYIFVKGIESGWVNINGTPHLRVWTVWRNSGVTPASEMRARVVASFVEREADFRFAIEAAGEQAIVVGPDSEVLSGSLDIGQPHIARAANATGHQFVWGHAHYRDAYPGSPAHAIEFCYKISIEGAPNPGQGTIRFNLYGEHNRYYDNPV